MAQDPSTYPADVHIYCDGSHGGHLWLRREGDHVEVSIGVAGHGGPYVTTAFPTLDELRSAIDALEEGHSA